MSPTVSIVVPLYNRKHLISRCVDSVLAQTFSDWELIIVDDGSTDEPQEILDALQARDARIRVLRQPNGGVSSARNTGINEARGEYIQFLDSDDELAPEALAYTTSVVKQMQAEVVAFGFGETCVDDELPVAQERVFEQAPDYLFALMQHDFLCVPWNKLWKRSLIGRTRFCPNVSWGEDFIFNIEVLRGIQKAALVQRCLYCVHVDSPFSLSRNYNPNGFDDFLAQAHTINSLLAESRFAELKRSFYIYLWSCYMQCVRKLCVCSGLPYSDIVSQLHVWNVHPRVAELKLQYAASNKTWVSRLLRHGFILPVPLVQRMVVLKSRIVAAVRAMKKRAIH